MKIIAGQHAPLFNLTDINGNNFNINDVKGKRILITFYRFASCPFCNLRLHNTIKEYKKYGDDFEVVAIFDSSLENLQKYSIRHNAPFPILADTDNRIHQMYYIEHSIMGIIKGIVFRFPSLMLSMFKGFIPWRIKGDMSGMPADFLIDENGIVDTAYYGKDEGDHIPFNLVKRFVNRRDETEQDLVEV